LAPIANELEREEIDEFIFNDSLHSLMSHKVKHRSFPLGWT